MTLTVEVPLTLDPTVSGIDGWEFYNGGNNAITGDASGGRVNVNVDVPNQGGYWVILSMQMICVDTGAAFASLSIPGSWDRIGAEWILGGPILSLGNSTREVFAVSNDPNLVLPKYLGRPSTNQNVFLFQWDVNVDTKNYQVNVNLARRLKKPANIPWEWL